MKKEATKKEATKKEATKATKKEGRKEEAMKKEATKATKKEGRKEAMKKETKKGIGFDVNAHNTAAILEHADGTREAVTAEAIAQKARERYMKETVAQLRKWAKARGIEGAEAMKKKEVVAALVADDTMPKEEKPKAKKARKEATEKKSKAAKDKAAAKKEDKKPKKEDKKPKKEDTAADNDISVTTSFEKEDARIAVAIDVQNMQNTEIAEGLNRMKELRLFEAKGASSMKDFVEKKCQTLEDMEEGRKGKYRGMSYSTVNMYIKANRFVYSMKDKDGYTIFESYGMHLIQPLIVPCRYFAAEVREAVEDGRISAAMSAEALKKLIKSEKWENRKEAAKDKAAAETEAETEAATEAETEAAEIPKNEKHNGVTEEAANNAAEILSAFIDEAKASKAKKEDAQRALDILMKRADI